MDIFFTAGNNSYDIQGMNIAWFLIILFEGKSFFNFLQLKVSSKLLGVMSVLFTWIGVSIGHIFFLPLGLDIVLAIQCFFYCGSLLKKRMSKYNVQYCFRNNIIVLFGMLLCFIVTLGLTYIVSPHSFVIYVRQYPAFPLCYMVALIGIVMVIYFSVLIENQFIILSKYLQHIGKNQRMLFAIHILDCIWINAWKKSNLICTLFFRIAFDLLLFEMCCGFKNRLTRCKGMSIHVQIKRTSN